MPFGRVGFPVGVAQTSRTAIPGDGLEMDQFAVAVPQSSPLGADDHLVVAEDGVHMNNWVLEDLARFKRTILRIEPIGEGQVGEDRLRIGGDGAFELQLNRQRQAWGGRCCGSVRDGRGERDAGCEGNRGRKGDRRGEGDGGGECEGGCGGKDPVDERLGLGIQQEYQQTEEKPPEKQSPTTGHGFAAHAEEGKASGFADRLDAKPDAKNQGDHRDHQGGLYSGMDIQRHLSGISLGETYFAIVQRSEKGFDD